MKIVRSRIDKEGLEAIRFATDFEVARAAGIYEGDGCCVINGHGKRSFTVSVSQKDPELLYRLRDLFGGMVKEYPNDRGTNVSKGRAITIYAWRVHGNRGRVFLTAIYPYLTARRKAKIDSLACLTGFMSFVGSLPHQDIIPFIHDRLAEWMSSRRISAKAADRQHRKEYYERKKLSDPTFMERRRQMTTSWRQRRKSDTVAVEEQ
jgi:hypothetical protein